jgi:cell wall-associated NlpC family hydrolase
MRQTVETLLEALKSSRSDTRTHLFDVHIEKLEGNSLTLAGRVLDQADFEALGGPLAELPALAVDTASIQVLRRPGNPRLHVGTNLTGLYESPGFGKALSSELVFGAELEILAEEGRWVFTRQNDGYLGWAYRPYLSDQPLAAATHLVIVPSVELRDAPNDYSSAVLSRVLSGTALTVLETRGEWARVAANLTGWLPISSLRALANLPVSEAERRETMVRDAKRMMGVPYLWGGCTGNGIDCSGFARYVHALSGMTIPRDADMQHSAARPIKAPEDCQPGDVVFFAENGSSRGITHVGISLGGWDVIHSSRGRNGVYIDNIQEREGLREIFVSAGTFF